MKLPTVARYLMVLLLVLASCMPVVITSSVLGEINLVFLAALWVILLICFMKAQKGLALVLSAAGGLAMAVPPVPNYVSPSGEQGPHFQFIGWSNIFEGGGTYGIVFFWLFYAMVFAATALLLRGRNSPATVRTIP